MILVEQFTLGGCGPTVAIKDSIDVAGHPTRAGSRALADAPPAAWHADVVEALLSGGARIVGKANMHELAYGVTGINRWTGTPINPNYPGHMPGGSSSGSAAAVAAGIADIGIGTDTGGSIRIPGACCGVFGLKPSFGRIGRRGVQPAETSLDCVGPLARDMAMIEQAMALIDPSFHSVATPSRIMLGMVEVDADPVVARTLAAAIDRPAIDRRPIVLPSFIEAFDAGLAVIAAETWAAFGHLAEAEGLGADVRTRLLAARYISSEQRAAAERVRSRFTREIDAALEEVDALVLPTMPCLPLTLDEAADAARAVRVTTLVRPFNLSGHPALTLPIEAPSGLPVGIQLVGRRGGDEHLCALAGFVEARL